MKLLVLTFFLLTNSLFAGFEDIHPPQLSWEDVVSISQKKKFKSSDGREWTFLFHKSDAQLSQTKENYIYRIELISKGLERYDPSQTVMASYDVLRKTSDQPWEVVFDLAFYLLTPASDQKENIF